jgi:hypothetical protein
MADLTATAAQVAPVFPQDAITRHGIANAAITKGQTLYRVAATGKVDLADANVSGVTQQPIGIALETKAAGEALSYLVRGELYGYDLSGLSYGASVYQSDTAGALADAASGTKTIVIGRVSNLTDVGVMTKILLVNFDPSRIW